MRHFFVLIFVVKWIAVLSNPVILPGCKSNVGDCEDLNELCEFIPLPHLLCDKEKIQLECPRLCNNCHAATKLPSIKSTESNSESNSEKNTENENETSTAYYTEDTTESESGNHYMQLCYTLKHFKSYLKYNYKYIDDYCFVSQ